MRDQVWQGLVQLLEAAFPNRLSHIGKPYVIAVVNSYPEFNPHFYTWAHVWLEDGHLTLGIMTIPHSTRTSRSAISTR